MKEFWKSAAEAAVAFFFSFMLAALLQAIPVFEDVPIVVIVIVTVLLAILLLAYVFDLLAALARMVSIWIERHS